MWLFLSFFFNSVNIQLYSSKLMINEGHEVESAGTVGRSRQGRPRNLHFLVQKRWKTAINFFTDSMTHDFSKRFDLIQIEFDSMRLVCSNQYCFTLALSGFNGNSCHFLMPFIMALVDQNTLSLRYISVITYQPYQCVIPQKFIILHSLYIITMFKLKIVLWPQIFKSIICVNVIYN